MTDERSRRNPTYTMVYLLYMKQHAYYVYIMSNKRRTVYYIGVTSMLSRRYIEHAWKVSQVSFTARYNITDLLYYEYSTYIEDAIIREKQIKKFRREKKLQLIQTLNPEMVDLFPLVNG